MWNLPIITQCNCVLYIITGKYSFYQIFRKSQEYRKPVLFCMVGQIPKIEEKGPSHKNVPFFLKYTPAYSSAVATAKLVDLRNEFVMYPPYSPDLTPRDFVLFPKKLTRGSYY